jgi:hypothetical protein
MTRYTIYKHSKNVLVYSFWAWLLSNLIFGLAYGFETEPTYTDNSIDAVLSGFINISALVMFATLFNKFDEQMKQDETPKSE